MSAYGALLKALTSHLAGAGLWGASVTSDTQARSDMRYPLLQFFQSADMREVNNAYIREHRLVLVVKGISRKKADALRMQNQISQLLANRGRDDLNPTLPQVGGWLIKTSTEGEMIWLEQVVSQTIHYYHGGAFYTFMMEETNG